MGPLQIAIGNKCRNDSFLTRSLRSLLFLFGLIVSFLLFYIFGNCVFFKPTSLS